MKLKYYSGAQVTSIIEKLPSKEYLEILNAFAEEPSSDVRENVHAHWITHEYKVNGYDHAYCECSACNVSRPITLFQLNFCPNCGAQMEEANDVEVH